MGAAKRGQDVYSLWKLMKMPPRNESQKDWHWRTAEEETSV